MSDLRELIEAVEAGTWGDDGVVAHPPGLGLSGFAAWQAYTGSLDAALVLMEAMLPGGQWSVQSPGRAYVFHGDFFAKAEADTPARALLLAILRSMAKEG